MLHASSIRKHYASPGGDISILRDLSLEVSGGESVAIMGPSGSGKSTLLNILGALDPPSGGVLKIGEIAPFDLPPSELASFRNRHIGFVFQEHYLLPQCTVLENVLLPSLAYKRPSCRERAVALLKEVGLNDRMSHRPSQLSGGERQRAALARSL
ncbi:MAG: ABC transporter ATP-binding protein, partial [Phycisphaerae bacterium]